MSSAVSLTTGDVAAFVMPGTGKFHIHRIILILEGAYIIKGDNTIEADGPVPEGNILGYISRVERNGENITLGMRTEKKLIAILSRFKLLRWFVRLWKLIIPGGYKEMIYD